MNQNIGIADRIVRVILGVVFVALGLMYSYWWYIPAVIALGTGIVGWCGLYTLCKCNTCSTCATTKPTKKAPVKKSAKKKK